METPRLKLFRRHSADCNHQPPYAKEFRIYEANLQKRKGQKPVEDCNCVISAEGTLVKPDGRKEYLRPKATGQRTWTGAHEVADQWQEWGGTQAPIEEYKNPVEELVTIEAAAKEFLAVKGNQNVSGDTLNSNESLVNDRLLPFAAKKGITHIQQMDNAKIWSDFRSSWVNQHIHVKAPNLPVNQSTANRLLSMTRNMIRFFIGRSWLSKEWASKHYGLFIHTCVKPKQPFSDEELDYIYTATKYRHKGTGFELRPASQMRQAHEDLVFVWTLRYTGLRITSDVAPLTASNLVPFDCDGYSHAIACHPTKTNNTTNDGNFVHIPIPNGNFPDHPNLTKALLELPLKRGRFFRFNPDTKTKTASWRHRIVELLRLTETMMAADGKAFSEHPHPHKFRHTFAARLLQAGVPIRIVAQYLGDTEATVRKHYAEFCMDEQKIAAGVLAEAMRKKRTINTRLKLVSA